MSKPTTDPQPTGITQQTFKYIKMAQFFPDYASTVTSWKHKLRGKNGRGNPVVFTPADIKAIDRGLEKMIHDIQTKKKKKKIA